MSGSHAITSGAHPGSVVELAEAIRTRTVRVSEVATAHLERIEQLNTKVNAIVCLAPDVLDKAAAADAMLDRGDAPGPLHGVPFTVKDTLAVAGYPATAGSAALAGYSPDRTAPVIARLLDAGAIFLGKTNCSEFAVDTHAGNLLFGDSRNPLDLQRTPGGSSGGDAAAVAAGMAAFGIGTDFGGSIRWPAHCTGIACLRPSLGRLPGTGILPYDISQPVGPPNSASLLHRYMTAGPMARAAADLELLTRVMAGPDGQDSQAVAVNVPESQTVDIRVLRVAWCDGEGSVPVRADVAGVIATAARFLSPMVAEVSQQRPPRLNEAADLFVRLRDLEGLPEVAQIIDASPATISQGVTGYLTYTSAELGRSTAATVLAKMLSLTAQRDAVRAQVLAFMQHWPILLLPVACVPAPLIGTTSATCDDSEVPWSQLGSCCRAISILGLPAAVVRVGTGDDGMPIGVQIVGRPFHDHQILAIAEQLDTNRTAREGDAHDA